MMDIFYEPTDGSLLFTIAGEEPHQLKGARITVPDADLHTLSGWRVVDGALVRSDLRPARDAAIRAVNAAVGVWRQSMITDMPGQLAIYQAKATEARAWLRDPAPVPADYPLICAEIGITAPTAGEVAQVWLNLAALSLAALAQSEHLRLSAQVAITAAPDETVLAAAIEGFTRTIAAAAAPKI
jgi:hypothetical protein